MQNQISEPAIIVIAGTILVLLLLVFIFLFFFTYQRRQVQYHQEKALLRSQFEQEILKSQIEVQNSTLQQIGQELHDNIGQLLSVAKLKLNVLDSSIENPENRESINETNEIIGQCIHDLRSLTKSLDGHFVEQFGLQESIAFELQRIRKIKKFETEMTVSGDMYGLGFDKEIILFRIFQEFLNNSIKHSEAKNIQVKLNYHPDQFHLILLDDGKGFDRVSLTDHKMHLSGSGLRHIEKRCKLIGASCELVSSSGNGTQLDVILEHSPQPYNQF